MAVLPIIKPQIGMPVLYILSEVRTKPGPVVSDMIRAGVITSVKENNIFVGLHIFNISPGEQQEYSFIHSNSARVVPYDQSRQSCHTWSYPDWFIALHPDLTSVVKPIEKETQKHTASARLKNELYHNLEKSELIDLISYMAEEYIREGLGEFSSEDRIYDVVRQTVKELNIKRKLP